MSLDVLYVFTIEMLLASRIVLRLTRSLLKAMTCSASSRVQKFSIIETPVSARCITEKPEGKCHKVGEGTLNPLFFERT